jgi:hypothetical protein
LWQFAITTKLSQAKLDLAPSISRRYNEAAGRPQRLLPGTTFRSRTSRGGAFVSRRITDFKTTWLVVGVAAGLCLSYFWPHEPALAVGTDRSEKFALSIVPVTEEVDAIFVLDFLTGRLQGHVMNDKFSQFSHAYFRNVIEDYDLAQNSKPVFAIVGGNTLLVSSGPGTMAHGVVYIGELTTGLVNAYGFQYNETNQRLPPQPLEPLDRFQFREPAQEN